MAECRAGVKQLLAAYAAAVAPCLYLSVHAQCGVGACREDYVACLAHSDVIAQHERQFHVAGGCGAAHGAVGLLSVVVEHGGAVIVDYRYGAFGVLPAFSVEEQLGVSVQCWSNSTS